LLTVLLRVDAVKFTQFSLMNLENNVAFKPIVRALRLHAGGQRTALAMCVLLLFWLVLGCAAMAGPPSISNLRAKQRAGTRWVDIYFDVTTDYPPLRISLAASENGGATFNVPVVSVTGDVGPAVVPGAGRHIVWDAGNDWVLHYTAAMRFRITAEDSLPSAEFVQIPAGVFQMGDPFSPQYMPNPFIRGGYLEFEITEGQHETPVHSVSVSAFKIQSTEVTRSQWEEVDAWARLHGYDFAYDDGGATDETSPFSGPFNHPVVNISWSDAVIWCNASSERDGLQPCYREAGGGVQRSYPVGGTAPICNFANTGYRLPTEAEWEKAARGGLAGKHFPRGNTLGREDANFYSEWYILSLDPISGNPVYQTFPYWPYDVCPQRGYHPIYEALQLTRPPATLHSGPFATSPVKAFPNNGYGVYDMDGNVSELCWDYYQPGYYSSSPSTDPTGPTSGFNGPRRVVRGGNYMVQANSCRASARRLYLLQPSDRNFYTGFRLVRRP
jgi:sulfatase modifying factor 1